MAKHYPESKLGNNCPFEVSPWTETHYEVRDFLNPTLKALTYEEYDFLAYSERSVWDDMH